MQTTAQAICALPPRSDERSGIDAHEPEFWEVRIEWRHVPDVTWPTYTHDRKLTRDEAEDAAGRAITFGQVNESMWAVKTFVRGPGSPEWREVACRQAEASATETTEGERT